MKNFHQEEDDLHERLDSSELKRFVEELAEKVPAVSKYFDMLAPHAGEVQKIHVEDWGEYYKNQGEGQVELKNGEVVEGYQVDTDMNIAHDYTEHPDGYRIWWGYREEENSEVCPFVSVNRGKQYYERDPQAETGYQRKTSERERRIDIVFIEKAEK